MKQDQKSLTPRSTSQSDWYTEVITRAKLADYSPVRGCMVIRPYGYAIWERIQAEMDKRIKALGVQNAYFPVFIPYSFLQREADHVEGFAPEVALVTHVGDKELEEKLVVRPTSETIIYEMFKDWIQSYRDLPLKVNQWCNIVRWEKRTTPFLRTTEFLWQEGHTAHATREEADEMVKAGLDMYAAFAEEFLAIYSIKGRKTEAEKFAGAEYTTTFECMMKDKKALQSGTSHLLGQGFAKAFDVQYLGEDGDKHYAWTTSWGLSTRIIGAIILMHGDDKGLVLPPMIAPTQALIVPIFKAENKDAVAEYISKVEASLKQQGIRYEVDWSENSPGWKFSEGEMRGIPLRIEVGSKDMDAGVVTVVKRTDSQKQQVQLSDLESTLPNLLETIQTEIYESAKKFTNENIIEVSTYEEFKELVNKTDEAVGFVKTYFCGDKDVEAQIKEETKYTSRCVPLETYDQEGKCFITGKPGKLTIFGKAY
ncbi:MAG: proline--tRNA ligase [Candidatus Doudnabacteria bacterium]|nr:proline--tRNA ligase [Candidatus Doudnabacteria bacterium]